MRLGSLLEMSERTTSPGKLTSSKFYTNRLRSLLPTRQEWYDWRFCFNVSKTSELLRKNFSSLGLTWIRSMWKRLLSFENIAVSAAHCIITLPKVLNKLLCFIPEITATMYSFDTMSIVMFSTTPDAMWKQWLCFGSISLRRTKALYSIRLHIYFFPN